MLSDKSSNSEVRDRGGGSCWYDMYEIGNGYAAEKLLCEHLDVVERYGATML